MAWLLKLLHNEAGDLDIITQLYTLLKYIIELSGWGSGDALPLYSCGNRFESWSDWDFSWIYSVSPVMQMSRYYLDTRHDSLISNPYSFTIIGYLPISFDDVEANLWRWNDVIYKNKNK
jgi:hypothetical protein